ncbi:MAG TPA: hypothetical protein VHK24_04110 [Steroidobacter sp.]|nr:hypothetical protein [Steroidobacter sp.]
MLASSRGWGAEYTFIVAGLGGEPQYEARFREQANALAAFARQSADADAVIVLSGPEATRNAVRRALTTLTQSVQAQDAVTIVLIGHGSFDGEDYRLNLPGPDPTGRELAAWFDQLPSRRQLIVNATSASGAVAEDWKRKHRIVITATKSGGERTATRFAQHWTAAATTTAADVNKDDLVTAAEAFDYARRQVETAFKADAALATEHARLEGENASTFAVAGLGAAHASAGPETAGLLAQRGALELRLNEVKERKTALTEEAYYDELEQVLVKLALLQRRIDASRTSIEGGG